MEEYDLVEITDPAELASLNANEWEGYEEITDPAELSELNGNPTAKESWYEDPVMASRAALDGLWFGWSDEVGAAVAAGAAKVTGEERPYSEIYSEMLAPLQQERDQYSEDHPVASAALEVAGGVFSPANIVGGKAIMGAKKLSNLQKAGTGAAVAAAEGGVYGAGASAENERTGGAAIGAALGAATFGALKGVGTGVAKVADEASKRRVAQDLGKGDTFKPINLAEAPVTSESGRTTGDILPWFYREVVGKTFGGRGLIEQQSKRWSRPAKVAAERTEEHLAKVTRNAKQSITEMETVLKRRTLESIDSAKEASARNKGAIIAEGKSSRLGMKEEKLQILPQKIQAMDAETNAAEAMFRHNAYKSSLPTGATNKEIAEVAGLSSQRAMEKVDSLWAEKGFAVTKGKQFRVSPKKILADIDRIFNDDVLASSTVLSSGQPNQIRNFVEQYLAKHAVNGKISGEALTQLRSQIGLAGNAMSDAGGKSAALGSVIGTIQDAVDDVIVRQLSTKQAAKFTTERTAWAHNRILRASVAAASKKGGQRGEFTTDDWLANVVKESPRQAREGQGPLQRKADEVADLVARRDEVLTQAAKQADKANIKAQQASVTAQEAAVTKEMSRLKRELAEINRSSGATAAKNRRALAKKSQIAELTDRLASVRQERDMLKAASPAEKVTPFERLFANFLMGGGGMLGTAALPVSIPLSNLAARQSTQRLVAGQTRAQEAVQRQLAKDGGSDLLKRVTSREIGKEAAE
tara:strand:- start:29 stop:2290 length:2262 start_codon:yes stop_codon:yes gene_type:complete